MPRTLRWNLTRAAGPGGTGSVDRRMYDVGHQDRIWWLHCSSNGVQLPSCGGKLSMLRWLWSNDGVALTYHTVQPVPRDLWAGFGRPRLSVSTEDPFNYSSSCTIPTLGRRGVQTGVQGR